MDLMDTINILRPTSGTGFVYMLSSHGTMAPVGDVVYLFDTDGDAAIESHSSDVIRNYDWSGYDVLIN